MARRFYVSEEIHGDSVRITGAEARHMVAVLRHGPGAELVLFDGSGSEVLARIESASTTAVELTVLKRLEARREAPLAATVAVSIPKGSRMEQLIRGCCELGADRIVPLLAERTVATGGDSRLERWRRVAVEAAKQSGRTSVCEVSERTDLDELLSEMAGYDLALFGAPGDDAPFIRDVFEAQDNRKTALLLVGPEGGFTAAEHERMRRAGALGVSLGRTILRVETAAVAMLAMILYGATTGSLTSPPERD